MPFRVLVGVTIVAAVALSMLASPARAQRGNPQLREGGQSIDEMVAEFLRDNAVPGLTMAIVQAPYVTRAAGYGVSDATSGRLASPNTLYRVDGLARAYAGVAVVQLVEAGKLALDQPVRARLPDAPAGLSVRQLLGRRPTAEDARLLRRLVERAAGESYAAYVRRNQIDRLGLQHTVFASELGRVRHEEVGAGGKHREFLKDRALIDPTEVAVGSAADAGDPAADPDALYASAVDVSLWDIALAGELLVRDPALRRVLYSPPPGPDGRPGPTSGPWDFPGHPGLMVVTGSGGGFSSLLSRFTDPGELVCVTLLANKADLDLTQLARRIAGAYDPRLGPPPRAAAMRAQQSPFSLAETRQRLARVLAESSPRAEVWEENGEVWIAVADPVSVGTLAGVDRAGLLSRRAARDAALLSAVSP
jgi:CubicO group peptidase (beta-lactamase class C family)